MTLPSRIAVAVTVPSLAVVPDTWTVCPRARSDTDAELAVVTAVAPEVVTVTPTLDDPPCERFGQHRIGIQRQMRTVLLRRSHRHAKDRGRVQALRYLLERQIADQP